MCSRLELKGLQHAGCSVAREPGRLRMVAGKGLRVISSVLQFRCFPLSLLTRLALTAKDTGVGLKLAADSPSILF
jgi:hypothetical protein